MHAMHTTSDALCLLRSSNPLVRDSITEDRLRHALRRGLLERPPIFAGRLVWSEEHVRALAFALGVTPPDLGATPSPPEAAGDGFEP